MDRKLPALGIVGVRGYGRHLYDAIKGSDLCNITACLHPDEFVAEDAAGYMDCEPFADEDAFFADDRIDAVILAVPNEFHFIYAQKAIAAGKHVLVEKPLTNTLIEAETLLNLANEKSVVLMVGHNYRKSGFIRRMHEELKGGTIGKTVAAEFNMGHGGGLKFGPEKWRFHKDKCPGGPLNMLGTHLIDASNFLFGKVKSVSGTVKNLYADTTAEDMSMIQLEYENGVVVNITNLYNSVSTEYINIYGTDGALRFTRWPQMGLWYQPKDVDCDAAPYRRLAFDDINGQKALFEEFLNIVIEGDVSGSNALKALEVVRTMETVLGDTASVCSPECSSQKKTSGEASPW